jgi:hypothetical protein
MCHQSNGSQVLSWTISGDDPQSDIDGLLFFDTAFLNEKVGKTVAEPNPATVAFIINFLRDCFFIKLCFKKNQK